MPDNPGGALDEVPQQRLRGGGFLLRLVVRDALITAVDDLFGSGCHGCHLTDPGATTTFLPPAPFTS